MSLNSRAVLFILRFGEDVVSLHADQSNTKTQPSPIFIFAYEFLSFISFFVAQTMSVDFEQSSTITHACDGHILCVPHRFNQKRTKGKQI